MKTPQAKPSWLTGVYVGNGTVVPETETPTIVDDGTLDTLVRYRGKTYRFMSEFRYEFDSDDAFLDWVKDEVDDDLPFVEV
tara:strand:+ start:622 stop:864 length:243 start_codon:yes stop_codon:yes gene_type:complete